MTGAMSTVCMTPSEIPRPIDGLVKPQASPTGTIPVAHGRPSDTKCRVVLAVAAIEMTPLAGVPSAQWA